MEMSSANFIRQLSGTEDGAIEPTSREAIADVFRRRAGGVAVETADARTKAFYRASGQHWALALG